MKIRGIEGEDRQGQGQVEFAVEEERGRGRRREEGGSRGSEESPMESSSAANSMLPLGMRALVLVPYSAASFLDSWPFARQICWIRL